VKSLDKWRFVDLDVIELPFLHAIEEAVAEKKVKNTLLLWRADKPYLTLGYFQNVYEEVDVQAAKELGVPIIRRMGGGGTGYLTPTVLAYSIIADERSKSMPKNVEETYKVICNGVTLGLKELGLDATFVPINDVLIGGKKFSGSSQHRSFGMIIQHGFITTEIDLPTLALLIKAPKEKLQDKGLTKIEDRITWINKETLKSGKDPFSLDQIKKAIRTGFEKALNITLLEGDLTDRELEPTVFDERFEQDTWNINPRLFKRVNATYIHKAKKGVIRINAYITDNRIIEIMITGDYLMHPVEAIVALEAMLRGVRADETSVRQAVTSFYSKGNVTTPGASPEDFITAIVKAIGKVA
jgi:lipoate-protein ligase A